MINGICVTTALLIEQTYGTGGVNKITLDFTFNSGTKLPCSFEINLAKKTKAFSGQFQTESNTYGKFLRQTNYAQILKDLISS